MLAFTDQHADSFESLDVSLFGRRQRRRSEMGEYLLHQIANVSNLELQCFV
jgi:hypothetical protein